MDAYHLQESCNAAREPMFEKPLTPSDVGKLNRLVIPKQYAEKYFPLASESGEKGLLLSFEDEAGKAWRFRYSYWTSSQSYVLTKGWSRYVKEKRLDAGDLVIFERALAGNQFFIGCRRHGSPKEASSTPNAWNQQAFYNPYNAGSPMSSYLYMSSMQNDCFIPTGLPSSAEEEEEESKKLPLCFVFLLTYEQEVEEVVGWTIDNGQWT
ncbi:hypothetical protein J5N97_012168 [Dioscorea zingiberensis]|uniref:TF-B3 domain-containing protein n=1 Tax=Dioscorea zingiberensis TaxID=325984 RepID=A0A9D5CP93_9LILI|nr:hypothetical protein J5N97_012168 [Dioscorea zingiberensis]